MKTSTNRIVTCIITIIMVMCTICATAQAYENSVDIYVDGARVEGVQAFLTNDGEVWVSDSFKASRKLFPKETADLYFPNVVQERTLKEIATAFGYSMKLNEKTAYLTKNGSSSGSTANNGSNNGSNSSNNGSNGNTSNNNSNTSNNEITITTNGTKITGVNAYLDANGTVWLKDGYTALKKVLPEENVSDTSNIPVMELDLKVFAEKYGYTYERKDTQVTLTKTYQATNTVKVYVNGMRVQNVSFTLGAYQEVQFDYRDIYRMFPEALIWNIQMDSSNAGQKYSNSLKNWAEYFKYSYVQNGLRVYLNNNGSKPIEIHANGRIIDFPDVQPLIKDGRTMVPVRAVGEMLGCNVEWLNGTVKISSNNKTTILYPGAKVYTVNGKEYAMDVAPCTQDGRTLVPIRFIAEAFNFNVEWNGGKTMDVVTLSN